MIHVRLMLQHAVQLYEFSVSNERQTIELHRKFQVSTRASKLSIPVLEAAPTTIPVSNKRKSLNSVKKSGHFKLHFLKHSDCLCRRIVSSDPIAM